MSAEHPVETPSEEIHLSPEVSRELVELAERNNLTIEAALHEAVNFELFLEDQMKEGTVLVCKRKRFSNDLLFRKVEVTDEPAGRFDHVIDKVRHPLWRG